VEALSELVTLLPVLAFDPVSSALVTGPAEERRRFVDFLLFHVEPEFLVLWRRYNRALRQRNGLLKAGGHAAEFDAFEREMAATALPLHRLRAAGIARLGDQLAVALPRLSPGFRPVALGLRAGWRHEEQDLADALYLQRERDRELGYTTQGPHRADLRIEVAGLAAAQLSRGQAKVLCLALVVAQAAALVAGGRQAPVLCLDDLFAELDADHAQRAVAEVATLGAQAWISSPAVPDHVAAALKDYGRFHVEHGEIRPA
jgi:DNA replication and repair protein RecF